MLKKPFLLLLFLCFGVKAFCAVFVVTSNADSGAGTLRDAIIQSTGNGTAVKDYITFNLADTSLAGRTITLVSQLPDVSSNLVIDGSTQPGAFLGVSTAKILLLFQVPIQDDFAGFRLINQSNIEIYGIELKSLTNFSSEILLYSQGFKIWNCNNIEIGDVNKGNVVSGFQVPLGENLTYSNDSLYHYNHNIVLKSNFFAIEDDGNTLSPFNDGVPSMTEISGKIQIGGASVNEGNLFATGVYITPWDVPDTVTVQNNLIGVNYDATVPISSSWGLEISSSDPLNTNIKVEIDDNIINAHHGFGNIFCGNLKGTVTILRNYIGTNKTKTKSLVISTYTGIFLLECDTVQIGSNNTSDANFIGYCTSIVSSNCGRLAFNKNSFYCRPYNTPIYNDSYGQVRPICKFTTITTNAVLGTSTANASIELFYSDACKTCAPQTYFASTTADNNGNWSYSGPITGTVIASATYDNQTSEFTKPSIDVSNVKVISSCGGLGSITGAIPYSATNIKWVDSLGNIVGTSPNLINVNPGKYKLLIQNGDCADSTSYYQINPTFQVDSSQVKVTEPSCNNSSGSISGIFIINNNSGQTNLIWKDSGGKVWARSATLINAPAGIYTLFISSSDSTCVQTYGPVVLKNTTGPNIDQSHIKVQSTNCGQSTGSITNIPAKGTGTLTYNWVNSATQTVSTDSILVNQPAGTYKLQVTDNTQCGPVYSSDINIPETNGITIDESKAITSTASCGKDNGAVTGIIVTGATQYQWVDANNNTVGTSADLQNVASGNYTLIASNGFGCSVKSKPYFIAQPAGTIYPTYPASFTASCFGQNTGSLTVTTDALAKTLRWVNSQNQPAGNTQQINGLAADVYSLYLTDANGCESFYGSYNVPGADQIQIVPGSEQITPDQCSTNTGSISNIQVTGGIPPYSYSWTKDQNNIVFSSSLSISGLGTGNYQLVVNDSRGCAQALAPYVVGDQFNGIPAPLARDIQLCTPGIALLQVQNAAAGYSYRLYDSGTSITPIDEQINGVFKVTVNANTSYYVSQFTGSCESSRTKVNVTVGLSGVNIANTFTPNGDNINDYWQIAGIENYPDALVQIFNRYGQKLFESKGYGVPFDGTYKGQKLPAGVYYYIINLNTKCNLLSGNLTILR